MHKRKALLMPDGSVQYEVTGRIATITLNRPDQLNAMNRDMFQGLARAFTNFVADDIAHVAILTGAGRRAFSAGLDLKERTEGDDAGLGFPDIRPLENPFWPRRDNLVPKPVIAAVNGYAMGGGFYLALQADLIVASTEAQFEVSEVARGCVAGWETGILHQLPMSVAAEIALGGRLTARRAYDAGIINEVIEPEALLTAARRRAEAILRIPPLTVRRNLELLRRVKPTVPSDVWELEQTYIEECRRDPDASEAVAAFLEKRPPVWHRDRTAAANTDQS